LDPSEQDATLDPFLSGLPDGVLADIAQYAWKSKSRPPPRLLAPPDDIEHPEFPEYDHLFWKEYHNTWPVIFNDAPPGEAPRLWYYKKFSETGRGPGGKRVYPQKVTKGGNVVNTTSPQLRGVNPKTGMKGYYANPNYKKPAYKPRKPL
jgi:hypothetical protein